MHQCMVVRTGVAGMVVAGMVWVERIAAWMMAVRAAERLTDELMKCAYECTCS